MILASGGFAANPELVGRYIVGGCGQDAPAGASVEHGGRVPGGARRRGTRERRSRRVLRQEPASSPAVFPPERFVEVSQLYGRYAVALNRNGERYADEAADWSETALTRATARQPGLRAWYVVDGAGLRERVRERTVGEMVATAREVGGTVLEAGSQKELARRLAERGLPADAVLHTLDEYNAAVASGKTATLAAAQRARAARTGAAVHRCRGRAGHHPHHRWARCGRQLQGAACFGQPGASRPLRRRGRGRGVSAGGYTSGLAAALVFGLVAGEQHASPLRASLVSTLPSAACQHGALLRLVSTLGPFRPSLVSISAFSLPLGSCPVTYTDTALRQ